MTKETKIATLKIIIASSLLFIATSLEINNNMKVIIYIIAYLIVGLEVVIEAMKHIGKGQIFDEQFLMSLATIGALIIGEYLEAVLVMLLYQVGETFQSYAIIKSKKSVTDLMNIRPDYANIEKDGSLMKISPEKVKVGDLIIVQPGEKIPLDGIVEKGSSTLDTSALTGESLPQEVIKNDQVLSGCINKTGILTIKVTKKFEESTASEILNLVENASNKKAKAEKFITKFAKYYTPVVVVLALLLAIIPPLIINGITLIDSLKRAMTFLVISCPCALVISVPLGFFGGIGGASRQGILIKGSNYLETLANTKTIVFDKTGTLTEGKFQVIKTVSKDQKKTLEIASLAEIYSNHPIALAIKSKTSNLDSSRVTALKEIAGKGISVKIDQKQVYVGNIKLMEENNITCPEVKEIETIVYVAVEGKLLGYIIIADKVKVNAKKTIKSLQKNKRIKNVIMLTGDKKEIAEKVAKELKLDKVYYELLPQDKVLKLEEILKQQPTKDKVAFVGDGLNDAPVLTRADIGIAMGALGSDAAIEAADVVIMDDDLEKIGKAITLSERTLKIVKQNIYLAISVKIIFLILGAIGICSMMSAVFADVGVSILAILNSMRTLNIKNSVNH